MTTIAPCLWFKDDAEEAVGLYTRLVPDSRIGHVQRAVTDYPGGKAGGVLMIEFTLAGRPYLALNAGTEGEYTDAVSFSILCDTQAEIDRLWDGLIAGGGKPVQCGWLHDRWGVRWQVTPRELMAMLRDADQAKAARAFQAMMGMVKLDIEALRKAYAGTSAG